MSLLLHAKSLQWCPTLCDPMDCSCQSPLSMGFSRQEYWSGLSCPPPGDLPDPGIKPTFLIAMINLDSVLKTKDITLLTKVHIAKAMVFPLVMYRYESWTIKKAEHQRIDAFELWCWRKPDLKETRAPQCSSQHCLWQPGHESNLDAHQQTNG